MDKIEWNDGSQTFFSYWYFVGLFVPLLSHGQ